MSAETRFTLTPRVGLAGLLAECRWPRVEYGRADHELAARLASHLPDLGRVRNHLSPEEVRQHVEKIRRRHLGSGWQVDGIDEAEGDGVYARLDVHYEKARRRALAAVAAVAAVAVR